ncbi:MAG: phosphatidylglycerophosphatase A [Hoeflea sp.]|uniref:phosphatidylglycerophosphatase A family protein n=1 Tax=Hoeflea sp. TaxID=1940281 RepID=UPI001DC0C622|nr:phosphatidylglycerophosphatase A [Hoeflea sp.]MBU4530976.1 phosphatidylglycerophosphatase A [Alphaproteobacteria bacterium]MBU4542751.1 phosphatidylglycerophosphatase A [Alphaproteobacteria bacterium]MBU4552563.1 phosphatidylglycerophosphatase A [Alphaproteobacteria bacterium]MBV1722868.1 phosphatidylglycerophosphatase A [Hoeflea sp.]MBV1762779.1 phosphatidylglycerophosphatase A [Hoeflea sp.]
MKPGQGRQPKLKGRKPELGEMVRKPHQIIALVFGCGLSPIAPGAVGSLAGFGLFFALQPLGLELRIPAYVGLVALASWAALRTGQDLEAHDHNSIVIDETIGMSLTLEVARMTVPALVAAYLLFRLFDVWKPWPVYLADRARGGGFMVILDDILAACWAGAVLLAANLLGIF